MAKTLACLMREYLEASGWESSSAKIVEMIEVFDHQSDDLRIIAGVVRALSII